MKIVHRSQCVRRSHWAEFFTDRLKTVWHLVWPIAQWLLVCVGCILESLNQRLDSFCVVPIFAFLCVLCVCVVRYRGLDIGNPSDCGRTNGRLSDCSRAQRTAAEPSALSHCMTVSSNSIHDWCWCCFWCCCWHWTQLGKYTLSCTRPMSTGYLMLLELSGLLIDNCSRTSL